MIEIATLSNVTIRPIRTLEVKVEITLVGNLTDYSFYILIREENQSYYAKFTSNLT